MTWPRISIVTPSYNQGTFLETTLRSVIEQGYPNLEYIVMDGGSTDGSVDIIRRYSHWLSHWESCKDRGQADAIFRGFERSNGEVLGWLNSDDVLLPGSLAAIGQYFKDHPEDECVVGGSVCIDANGRPIIRRSGVISANRPGPISFKRLLFWKCGGFCQPASFWRRSAFVEVAGFDRSLQFSFDYDLYLRLAQRRPLASIPSFLACFRVHDRSKTSTLRSVMDAEDAMLWGAYGRYQHSPVYRRLMFLLYATSASLEDRKLQAGLLFGVVPCPFSARQCGPLPGGSLDPPQGVTEA